MTDNYVTRKQIRSFPRSVQDLIMDVVNNHGVRIKFIAGGDHVRLLGDNPEEYPFKISPKVPPEHVRRKLIPWLERNCPTWGKEEEEVVQEVVKPFRCGYGCDESFATPEEVNEHYGNQHRDEPVEDEMSDEEWKETRWDFETNGKIFRCITCRENGINFFLRNMRGARWHQAAHTGEASDWAKQGANAKNARTKETEQMTTESPEVVEASEDDALAITHLASRFGMRVVSTEQHDALLKEATETIEKLRSEVEELTKERDEAIARLGLIKEAMKA